MLLLLLTFSMGLTPFFELFAGPLYFRLANYVQRIGWGCSSEKSNPRLPGQTGVNRTVHTLFQSCTVIKVMYNILHGVSYSKWHTVKEGTISYSIQRLYSIKGDIIYVLYYITVSRDQIQESSPASYGI